MIHPLTRWMAKSIGMMPICHPATVTEWILRKAYGEESRHYTALFHVYKISFTFCSFYFVTFVSLSIERKLPYAGPVCPSLLDKRVHPVCSVHCWHIEFQTPSCDGERALGLSYVYSSQCITKRPHFRPLYILTTNDWKVVLNIQKWTCMQPVLIWEGDVEYSSFFFCDISLFRDV